MKYILSKKLGVLLIVAILIFIVGCTNDGGANPSASVPEVDSKSDTKNDSGSDAKKGGTLIIGMTAAGLPALDTHSTQGQEGYRFVGFQVYDGLTRFDLTQGEREPDVVPALAKSWEAPKDGGVTWTFHLRDDVDFHDGTHFNADAVIFNLERVLNQEFEYYSPQSSAGVSSNAQFIESYEKIDEYTITITTKEPWSIAHVNLAWVFMGSPDAIKKYGNEEYLEHPAGTGPFKFESKIDGQELVLVPNEDYYGEVPKLDKLILKPMPEPSTRVAALLAKEINWAEAPAPDSVARLKSDGYEIITGVYPHIWRAYLNEVSEPIKDVRVRQALNYAIDRESMVNDLIGGLGTPSTQYVYEGHPWFNEDAIDYSYDPDKAKQLLAEAGYPDGFDTRIIIPASGSGHMWPIPMTQFIQQNFADIGVNLKIDVVEWPTFQQLSRADFVDDRDALGYAHGTPTVTMRNFRSTFHSQDSGNRGKYINPKVDELIDQAFASYDDDERNGLIKEASKIVTDEAAILFVVHDLNSRALATNVKGFVQPQSWFIDLNSVTVE